MTRFYAAILKKGRIGTPGLAKLEAIARAMGCPPALWFGNAEGEEPCAPSGYGSIGQPVEHLRPGRLGPPGLFRAVERPRLRQLPERCGSCKKHVPTLETCVLPDGTEKGGAAVTFRESVGGVRCLECADEG